MAQQFLTVNGGGSAGNDEDAKSMVNGKPISNLNKLLSINTPSIDSNTNEDDASEKGSKNYEKKLRRQATESENAIVNKRPSKKQNPWYKKLDFSRPLRIIALLVFIYFMWTKQDVWVPRLLTSNTRIHRSAIVTNNQESADSSTITTTISSKTVGKEDNIENIAEKDELENNNEDFISSSSSSSKSSGPQKVNLRTRRNKMSFSHDRQKKKHGYLHGSSIDTDGHDDPEDDEEEEDKSSDTKESIISSERNSTKKTNQHSIEKNQNSEILVPLKSSLTLSTYDDILKQLRKNLKSRIRNREFFSALSKTTGLNKNKLNRFIYKKEYQLMTLQTFMTLLDSFHLMLLIVPK